MKKTEVWSLTLRERERERERERDLKAKMEGIRILL